MHRHRRLLTLIIAALTLGAVLAGLSACGYSSESKEVSEGQPVKLGNLHFNVVFSRFLNPNDNEDAAYLVGQPEVPPGSHYFGIFLEVQNKEDSPQPLPQTLTITDAGHQEFKAIPSESLYAFPLGGEVEAEEQIPVLDSTAQQGPIEGSLVLFELPPSASDERPLTLTIPSPEGPGKVILDL